MHILEGCSSPGTSEDGISEVGCRDACDGITSSTHSKLVHKQLQHFYLLVNEL